MDRTARFAVLAVLLGTAAFPLACRRSSWVAGPKRPDLYTSDEFQARVVDATTGEPVAHAAVVVLWRRFGNLPTEGPGIFRYEELRTDANGWFVVHRWGPRWVDRAFSLDARDPEIWILRRGYLLGYFDNTGALDPTLFSRSTVPARISKPAPTSPLETPRPERASSIWSGKSLPLSRASSPRAAVVSLAAAAPVDPHETNHVELPQFAAEWLAARNALEPGFTVSPPEKGFSSLVRVPIR